jgi:hypothetical protein
VPDRGHSAKKVSKPPDQLCSLFSFPFHFSLPPAWHAAARDRCPPHAPSSPPPPARPARRRRPPAPTCPASLHRPRPRCRPPHVPSHQGLLNLLNLCVFIFILYCHMLFNLLNLCVFIVILCVLLNLYYMFIEFSEFILRVYIMCL